MKLRDVVQDVAICHENMLPAAVVEIGELHAKAAHQTALPGEVRLQRGVAELPASEVSIEPVQFVIEMCDVEVGTEVAIHIGRVNAHPGLRLPIVAEAGAGSK